MTVLKTQNGIVNFNENLFRASTLEAERISVVPNNHPKAAMIIPGNNPS